MDAVRVQVHSTYSKLEVAYANSEYSIGAFSKMKKYDMIRTAIFN
jgi:hypothetical protein